MMSARWKVAALVVLAGLVGARSADAASWQPASSLSAAQYDFLTDDCFASPFPTGDCNEYPGAGGVDVAMNRRGDILVAWARRRNGEDTVEEVQARIRSAGGGWGPVQTLGTTDVYPPHELSGPFMDAGIDDAGNAIIVWPETTTDVTVVRAAQRAAGADFGSAVTLSPPGQDVQNDPRVAMSGSGRTIVVWSTAGPAGRVQYRSRRRTTGFSPVTDLTGGNYAAESARAAINDAGAAIVVWGGGDPAPLRARVRAAGKGIFGPERVLSSSNNSPANAEVAIDPQGRATAAWQLQGGVRPVPQARRLTAAGASAGAIETVTAANHYGGDYMNGPEVAPVPTGGAVVAWSDCTRATGPETCQAAVRRTAGGPFGPVRYVRRPADMQQLVLAVDTSRTAVLAWSETGDGQRAITARVSPTGTVSDVRALSPGTGQTDTYVFPALAVDGNGSTAAAWDSTRPNVGEIVQSSTFDGGGPALSAVVVPRRARRGRAVAMRAAASDPFSNVELVWRFGDGATASGSTAEHAYRRCGAYRVSVSARDGAGNTSTARRRVLVVASKCRIKSRIAAAWDVDGRVTKVTGLRVRGVPKDARVQARGPFGRRDAKRRGRTVNVLRALKKRRTLRAGQTLEIRITKPGYIGKVVRYKIRAGKDPRALARCLPAGRTTVRKRCS
jgi:hypothetical protein